VRDVNVDPTWVTHLNVIPAVPLYAIGAYFGNDQNDPDFSTIRLSIYAAAGDLLGSVDVAVNGNTSVDQFIGLRSDLPFTRVRFENFNDLGQQTRGYSVVIDDLVFAPSPPVIDSDNDGVPDDEDQCSNTAEGAVVDAHGCSIQQLVPCDGPLSGGRWKNHGHYVSTLGKAIEAFIAQGLIAEEEGEGILEAAARGDCGKK
jgi:hypothetical protein